MALRVAPHRANVHAEGRLGMNSPCRSRDRKPTGCECNNLSGVATNCPTWAGLPVGSSAAGLALVGWSFAETGVISFELLHFNLSGIVISVDYRTSPGIFETMGSWLGFRHLTVSSQRRANRGRSAYDAASRHGPSAGYRSAERVQLRICPICRVREGSGITPCLTAISEGLGVSRALRVMRIP
jgi:hypothetical protein